MNQASKIWQDAYRARLTDVEKVSRDAGNLKEVIKVLMETHRTSFGNWPGPNQFYNTTSGDIILQTDLDGDFIRLWTIFGAVDNLYSSVRKAKRAFASLEEKFTVTQVPENLNNLGSNTLFYFIEQKSDAKFANEDLLGKELMVLACFSPSGINSDSTLAKTQFNCYFGKTFLNS